MLLTDEQYVVKWLSQYGALPRAQIIKMLQKPPQTAEKILRNLKRQMRIADVFGGYYIGLDPMCQPDQRMILAIWVLLRFIDTHRFCNVLLGCSRILSFCMLPNDIDD